VSSPHALLCAFTRRLREVVHQVLPSLYIRRLLDMPHAE